MRRYAEPAAAPGCEAGSRGRPEKRMSAQSVRFYFDYTSPYSYIASRRVEEVCARNGAALEWMPMVLGGVFKAHGIDPPHTKSGRRDYLWQDLREVCAYHGIPFRERSEFPFHPILALRATLAVPAGEPRGRAVHALFRGAWAEDADLAAAEVVQRLLDEAGLDGAAAVEQAQTQPVKDALHAATDDAIARGIFGAPTFVVSDGKLFWGQDRLFLLDHYLRKAA